MANKLAKKPNAAPSTRMDDLPATRKMLHVVRRELKSEFASLTLKIDSRFAEQDSKFLKIDARFVSMDSRFVSIDARFLEQDARFLKMESKLDAISAKVEHTNLLVEEQNANNRIVLDGLQALWQRQTRLEKKCP